MNIVGKKIRRLRQNKDWSQADVAKQLKISAPAYSKIEDGTTSINLLRLDQLAILFELNIIDLLLEDGENPHTQRLQEVKALNLSLHSRNEEVIYLLKRIINLQYDVTEAESLKLLGRHNPM